MSLPSFGLFEYSDERELYMRPRPLTIPETASSHGTPGSPLTAGMLKNVLRAYRQVGRLIGMALLDGVCPGISFTDGAITFLLYPNKLKFDDAFVDQLLMKENVMKQTSLRNLLSTHWDDPEQASVVSDLNFSGLWPNGESISVNQTNIGEYVRLSARQTVVGSIEQQMMNIVYGMYEVLPFGRLTYLTIDELFGMLRGQPVIDRDNLRAATEYLPVGMASNIQIRWFWEIVYAFDEEQMRDFIKFVSGSSNPPIHNFTGYVGARKWLQINIQDGLIVDQVPLAQTCFVQLRIPRYTSLEVMRERLLFAIQNAKSMENV